MDVKTIQTSSRKNTRNKKLPVLAICDAPKRYIQNQFVMAKLDVSLNLLEQELSKKASHYMYSSATLRK
jgi:hypothetical protein